MSRILTIVGVSARAAACSAVRAGFSVHAADLFADADLRHLCDTIQVRDYPAGLADALTGPHSGGWMYTGALENYPALVDAWARVRPLRGNSGEVLRQVRNPQIVADALRCSSLPCPAVAFDAGSLHGDGSWLRKPLSSGGGLHIVHWDPHADFGPGSSNDYFQQFIEGLACSAVYVAARGEAVLLGITRQLIGVAWTGAPHFQYCGSIGPLAAQPDVARQFAEIGSALARQFNLVGLFGVDAVVNSQGVWPVEVNPRYTASVELLEWAYGIHAVEMHVSACESGNLPTPCVQASQCQCGKAILFASAAFVVTANLGSSIRQAASAAWPAVADIPVPGTTIEAGLPIVTVLAEAADEQAVFDTLRAQSARLRSILAE